MGEEPDVTGPSESEARDFLLAYRTFMIWMHANFEPHEERNEVVTLVTEYLGGRGSEQSVVARDLPPFEHVNLQAALDAWGAEPGRSVEVQGITLPPRYEPVTLQQLITGEDLPPLRLSAPALVDLPNGPGTMSACLLLAVLLVEDERGRYVVLVAGPTEHNYQLRVEVAGLDVESAQAVHAMLDELRARLNVYRGHVLDVTATGRGGVSLSFAAIPLTARDDVILPEAVLARVERHALGVAAHREALLAAGQHLKRGLLLYGPPGTGKTHTTRYLIGQMTSYTRLLLTGRALHAVGSAAELARDLQPAVVVLEDVDLVAEDRDYGDGSSTVLFDLLDAMDGAAGDADLLFVLTTNRADLLEPALAARPGRVDVAVEIDLPDQDARHRLLELYARVGTPRALGGGDRGRRRAHGRRDRVVPQGAAATRGPRVALRPDPPHHRDRCAHRARARRPARQRPAGDPQPARCRQRPHDASCGARSGPRRGARAAGLQQQLRRAPPAPPSLAVAPRDDGVREWRSRLLAPTRRDVAPDQQRVGAADPHDDRSRRLPAHEARHTAHVQPDPPGG